MANPLVSRGLAVLAAMVLLIAAACGGAGDVVELRYESGALRAQGRVVTDAAGERRLQGHWRFWYSTGQLQCEGNFADGRELDRDALLPEATCVPRAGRVGEWRTYSETGLVTSRGSYRAGDRHGPWRWLYEDGSPKAECELVLGKKNGHAMRWHANGEVAEDGGFVMGVPVGRHRTWHANGSVATDGRFESGLESGLHRRFASNGVVLEETAYNDGVRNGRRSLWNESGELLRSVTYVDGVLDEASLYEREVATGDIVALDRAWSATGELTAR